MSRSPGPDDEVIAAGLRRRASRAPAGRAWVQAELLPSVSARMTARRERTRAGRLPALAGLGAVAALLLVVIVGLTQQGSLPGGPYDEARSGDFVLTISAGEPVYAPGEPIDVAAQLAYDGPKDVVQLSGVNSLISGFGVRQLDGPLRMGPGWDLPCVGHELRGHEPLNVAYQKSGGWTLGEPHADFYADWFRDSVFWLPAGRWEVTAYADFFDAPECSGRRVEMQVSIVLLVQDPAAQSSPTLQPEETGPPTSPPQTSPPPTRAIPSPVIDRTTADTSVGTFELTIEADRGEYVAGEPIDLSAALTYRGPDDSATGYGVHLLRGFDYEQLDGALEMSRWLTIVPCLALDMRRDEPVVITGAGTRGGLLYDDQDPNASFYAEWSESSHLWLPVGIWRISTGTSFNVGRGLGCGASPVDLTAEIVIRVVEPGGSPPRTPTPAPIPTIAPTPAPTPGEGDFDLVPAHWQLASSERPTNASTSLRLDVTDPECSAGGSSDERIVGPQIEYEPDSVTITFLLEPDTSGATCEGFGGTGITVELAEPLGDRVLVDGGAGVARVLEHGPDLLVVLSDEPLSPAMMRFLHLISPETCITGREYDREGPDIEALTRMAEELDGKDGLIDDGRAWLGDWRDAVLEFGGFEAYIGPYGPRHFIAGAQGQAWLDANLPEGELLLSDLYRVEIGGGRTVWYAGYSSVWWPDRDEDC